jgi:DNA-binding LacI/PurR family transcriptional regulator
MHCQIATALDGNDRVRHKRSKSRLMAAKTPKRSSTPRRDTAKRVVESTDPAGPKGAGPRPQDGTDRGSTAVSRPVRIPTMQDIADASGVSQSTVSRVLTGAPNAIPINPATRERILEVARQMRYRPNPLARGLRGARTMLLGVIVREITDPFFAGAIDAISMEANRRGYNVVLGHAHGRADEAIALRAVLETRHCDAILLVGDISDQPRLMEDLQDTNVPVVGMWQGTAPVPGTSIIGVDNKFGVGGLMDHLLGLGHRKIAFVGGVFVEGRLIGDIGERRAAFLERAAAEGLETPEGFVRDARNTLSGGAGAVRELLTLPERPTAIVASTDALAIGALHAASHMGFDVPGDVSVVGFDDLPMAEYTTPSLTTVCMPTAEMAAAGVMAAVDEGQDHEATTVQILKPTVIVRESSGPVPVADRPDGRAVAVGAATRPRPR